MALAAASSPCLSGVAISGRRRAARVSAARPTAALSALSAARGADEPHYHASAGAFKSAGLGGPVGPAPSRAPAPLRAYVDEYAPGAGGAGGAIAFRSAGEVLLSELLERQARALEASSSGTSSAAAERPACGAARQQQQQQAQRPGVKTLAWVQDLERELEQEDRVARSVGLGFGAWPAAPSGLDALAEVESALAGGRRGGAAPAPARPTSVCMKICTSKSCCKRGADALLLAAQMASTQAAADGGAVDVRARATGCLGECKKGPALELRVAGGPKKMHTRVSPGDVPELLRAALSAEQYRP